MKLLVASQDCYVYVFNVPSAGAATSKSTTRAGPSSANAAAATQVDPKAFLSSSFKKHYSLAHDHQPGIFRR